MPDSLAMEHLVRTKPGSTQATDVVVDVPLDVLEADPYPTYAWMREHCPIAYVPETGRVFVTTWALCDEAGNNDTVFEPAKDIFNTVYGDPNVISLNGPAHRELRNAINPPFRPRAVAAYKESSLRTTAARYVEAIRDRGVAEASSEILEPISQRAVGDVLGFHDVPDGTLSRWFHDYGAYLVDFGRSDDVAARGRSAKADVVGYLAQRIHDLVAQPDGSALSHMLHDGMPAGRTRSVDDLIGSFGVLIVGGFQEPAHGIANTLLGLLGRPEQADVVSADPAGWSARAIDEGLRWLAPFGMTEKVLRADATLAGLDFPAGTEVGLMIGSANRDPLRFDDPDVYDLHRASRTHVAFGYGTHFCIGHSIARVLGQVVLEEMFTRLPGLRLDPNRSPVVHGWAVRGAKTLPVVWDA
ncbi:MAG TPA: cytochrome P450 [Actinomycetes bacterium]